jgi:hypothetical protein
MMTIFFLSRQGCFSNNPLQFLDTLSTQMETAAAYVNQLSDIIPHDNSTVDTLNDACGQDIISFLVPALDDLNRQLGILQKHIQQLVDTVSCHQISPLFRRISHGAMCIESPYALAVLWSCSLVLCILSFVMLTTRAALYNAVRHKKPRQKKPRRVVEKEFSEYQNFMKQYYDGTDRWRLDHPLPKSQHPPEEKPGLIKASTICLEFDDRLDTRGTFETALSSSPSTSEEDQYDDENGGNLNHDQQKQNRNRENKLEAASDIGGIHHQSIDGTNFGEDDSNGSEYDSEISDENDDDDDGRSNDSDSIDEQSAVMSFLSETRSIAMQTLQSLQKIKPLLASINPMLAPRHEQDFSQDDDEVFSSRDIREVMNDKVEPSSVCDDSMYLETKSMCDPPTTPGLYPVPHPMLDRNSASPHFPSMTNESVYTRSGGQRRWAARGESSQKDEGGKAGLFGHSARHLSQRRPNRTEPEHASVRGFDGPRVLNVLTTPSSVISALTPLAPLKPFSYLYRTKNDEKHFDDLYHDDDENDIFQDEEDCSHGDNDEDGRTILKTPQQRRHQREGLSVFSLSPDVDSIRPTKLEMSPMLTPAPLKGRPAARGPSHTRSRPNEESDNPQGKFSTSTTSRTVRTRGKTSYRDDGELESEPKTGTRSRIVQELVRRYEGNSNPEVISVRRKKSTSSSFPRGNQALS